MSTPISPDGLLIGALLRYPARAVQRRIIAGLNAAGFDDLRIPHMAVLQYPGPHEVRPSVLAERAGMSKQAMNQLLHSLERLGYIERHGTTGRARVVCFTQRGHAAWAMIDEILRTVEVEWSAELGQERFAQLKDILREVWRSPLLVTP
ncbi:MAG: MarR family transcriptional regulator [Chloroflexi bacterium]|jgi:DNA-binding MarR family transcriptional regulator|nr:MarR family transcriptional regulator [Chloroflexota bacterium]